MVLVKQREFYFGIFLFVVLGVGYYLLRELIYPGYDKAVWDNEIWGRYSNSIDGHGGSFWFYFQYLINTGFKYWYFLFPCGALIGFVHRDTRVRNLTFFLLLCILLYIVVCSLSQTKIVWYAAPLYPLLAIICGLFLDWICDVLRKQEMFKHGIVPSVAGMLLIFLVFIRPYSSIIESVYNYKESEWSAWWYEIPNYMRHALNDNVNIDGTKVIYSEWPSSILFYQKMLSKKNIHVSLSEVNDLNAGDKVIATENKIISEIESRFNLEMIDSYSSVKVYKIVSRK